jgi:hypothetical protein
MRTAKTLKFASRTVVASENVLMAAAGFNVVQIQFAPPTIIDQHVFALKDIREIPLIYHEDVIKKKNFSHRKSRAAMRSLVAKMKFAKLTIKARFAIAKTAMFGIQLHQLVKNLQFPNAPMTMNATVQRLVDKTSWEC